MNNPRSLLAVGDIREAARLGDYGVVLRRVRQARGLTQEQAGRLAGYSAATISRLETGKRRLADVATMRHLAAVLDVSPEVFGLVPGGAPGPAGAWVATVGTSTSLDGDDVRRRDLLAGLPAAVLLPASRMPSGPGGLAAMHDSVRQGLEAGGPASRQARDQLAAAVRYCDLNFSRFPPAVLAGEVTGLRMTAGQMLRSVRTDRSRRDLRVIAGWVSALSGNLSFVLADNTAALIHLSTAARLGTAAGDDDLACWALGAQAMTASAHGRHAEALELARQAYDYAHSPLRRAQILAWAELRALAGMGDQHQAARVMAAAQDQMAADPHGERPGRFGFDLAELRLHLAEASLALGEHAQARAHAEASTARTRTGRPGWAAATLVLARGEAAHGNHSDAAALAHQVLDTIPPQSLRQTSRVRFRDLDSDLSAAVMPVAAARELHDRLRALPPLAPASAR